MAELADDLSGDGMILINGIETEAVYYWLTVTPNEGPVIAEGSITGPEQLLKKLQTSDAVKLTLSEGPSFTLKCEGGRKGVRWVKAVH
jgi:hypothetical protein